MELQDKITLLNDCMLFSLLTQEQKVLIAQVMTVQKLAPKKLLIQQGTPSSTMHIISGGVVKIYVLTDQGTQIGLGVRGKGELIGILSLLDDQIHAANVETIESTTFLNLDKGDFNALLLRYPEISIQLLKYISHSIRESHKNLERVLSKKLEDRTWYALTTLASYFPDQTVAITHEELAQIIGATRSRVTEALQILQKEGKISLSLRKIKIM